MPRLAAGLAASCATLALGCGSSAHHRPAAHGPIAPPVAPRATVSPAGLPLGPAAFALKGVAPVGMSLTDAVPLTFGLAPRAGLLFDLRSGRVLWQRNALVPLRIASLTKMMTALVAVKDDAPDARVLIHRGDIDAAGSKVGVLPVGRRVPFESMLYGLLLASGNDAAAAIAEHVSGTIAQFVARMNEESARLGLQCTRFSSPSGFVDQRNFACAADLAILAHVFLAQPRLARVARTSYAVLPFPIKGAKLYLRNINPLFRYRYPGLTGIKTGETNASGKCFVATAERHGVRLGVVLLASPAPANQARQLLDDAFASVYHQARVREATMPPSA